MDLAATSTSHRLAWKMGTVQSTIQWPSRKPQRLDPMDFQSIAAETMDGQSRRKNTENLTTAGSYPITCTWPQQLVANEINDFVDGRYIAPCEAVWRIFGFKMQSHYPCVVRLQLHLPGG
ncbi:hypothetical protein BGZ76_008011, partial [Entomortierella beljakovae]